MGALLTPSASDALLGEIRACRACAEVLGHPPRPIVQLGAQARVLIVSQAPGRRAHDAGRSFADASGDQLRSWMGVDAATFYDPSRIAIAAIGFCYPGTVKGQDLPPQPRCAGLWQSRVAQALPNLRLRLLVGGFAVRHHAGAKVSLADAVRWRCGLDENTLAAPHPSWRTGAWQKRNPWFLEQVLPALRAAVRRALWD